MMYSDSYGTDWDDLDAQAAIERAYALGVSESLGETHADELDRLIDAVDTADDRALVRLAYDKGRSRGQTARAESETPESAWTTVVDEADREPVTVSGPQDLPPALRSLPMLDSPGDDMDRIRLPKFLTR